MKKTLIKPRKNEEAKLQHKVKMWFGQTWPEYNHLFFMVHNETISIEQGSYLKSMGLTANVSDMILIQPKHGHVIGIELKAPGSIHTKEHIENQLNWGKLVIRNGGFYIMTSCFDTLKEFVIALIDADYFKVHDMMENALQLVEKQFINKTIKF